MSIIKDEKYNEKRNRLEIKDDDDNNNGDGDDYVSNNTVQQNNETYNFYATNNLFRESVENSEEENID